MVRQIDISPDGVVRAAARGPASPFTRAIGEIKAHGLGGRVIPDPLIEGHLRGRDILASGIDAARIGQHVRGARVFGEVLLHERLHRAPAATTPAAPTPAPTPATATASD